MSKSSVLDNSHTPDISEQKAAWDSAIKKMTADSGLLHRFDDAYLEMALDKKVNPDNFGFPHLVVES